MPIEMIKHHSKREQTLHYYAYIGPKLYYCTYIGFNLSHCAYKGLILCYCTYIFPKLGHCVYIFPKLGHCAYMCPNLLLYLNVLIISLQLLSSEPPVHLIPTNTSPTNALILSLCVHDFTPYFSLNLSPLTQL